LATDGSHDKLLSDLENVGGLKYCPESLLPDFASWPILAYIGEPGGYGMGANRPVFYSKTAWPFVPRLFENPTPVIRKAVRDAAKSGKVKAVCSTKHIERRPEELVDLIEE
jgi:hypothetical protein